MALGMDPKVTTGPSKLVRSRQGRREASAGVCGYQKGVFFKRAFFFFSRIFVFMGIEKNKPNPHRGATVCHRARRPPGRGGRGPLPGRGPSVAGQRGEGGPVAPVVPAVRVGGVATGGRPERYTTVHTVFRVVSKRTALASVGFKFVSYMGFSKEACPLLLSWPA